MKLSPPSKFGAAAPEMRQHSVNDLLAGHGVFDQNVQVQHHNSSKITTATASAFLDAPQEVSLGFCHLQSRLRLVHFSRLCSLNMLPKKAASICTLDLDLPKAFYSILLRMCFGDALGSTSS